MKNKTTKLLSALCLTTALSSASFAQEEAPLPISGNVTIASDYVWRGLTQTDGEPAIQGGFDYAHESGFALGVWGSNVDFGSDASAEFDLYGSYAGEVDGFGYEVGYISYNYPSESAIDFEEVYVGGSYANVGLTYYKGLDDANDYVEASYGITVEGVDLSIMVGDYEDSYDLYGVGIGKSYGGLDFALNYTNTDPDNGSSGESNTVFSMSKSF
ncbi:TorF family putative porin [Candidatus Thioglobus sp.]|uniref:TorF family putative porin n=1 Tax=Candidatus Thioglobus sp. TaxID=2026721 RepID=UPI003D0BFC8A